jgi:hypothetical protein
MLEIFGDFGGLASNAVGIILGLFCKRSRPDNAKGDK